MLYILKGIVIGLILGMPVGAIGAMTIHRTLVKGVHAGIITGIGSSVADCLYACVGAFGVTVISDFVGEHSKVINILCGFIILFMGITKFFQNPQEDNSQCNVGVIKMFLSSFVLALMNPVAIMSFMVAFAYLGLSDQMTVLNGASLVLGVFLGTMIWWTILLSLVEYLKKKHDKINLKVMNQIFGVVFVIFAIIVFVKSLGLV